MEFFDPHSRMLRGLHYGLRKAEPSYGHTTWSYNSLECARAENRKVLTKLGFCVPTSEPVPQNFPGSPLGFSDLRPLAFGPQPVPDGLPHLGAADYSSYSYAVARPAFLPHSAHGFAGTGHRLWWKPLLAFGAWSFVKRMVKSRTTT